ncbi:hypothetical protein JCM10914A_56220 [Paenibacillus sp. JCM 10914]|uniref:hypothetical protein n=1 Tax=Paenibacillus sp. JCM 10914 TaxID=1236974 RepID=UPI00055D12DA|nr:hypothetical protein [Paenibacillus sp. JCM 10914]
MTIRIKFSENLADQTAMSKAGGSIVVPTGKKPMFSFPTEFHYRQYLTYKREMKNAPGGNQGR